MLASLSACKDDDDSIDYTKYYGWRDKNNAFAEACMQDVRTLGASAYFTDTVSSLAEPYSRFSTLYRVLSSANEDSLRKVHRWITPLYNSSCAVRYTLYDPNSVMEYLEEKGALNDQAVRNNAAIMDAIFFDGECKADTIDSYQVMVAAFQPSTVVKGWGDVLQRMHIGDRWLICVPWFLGYGQAGSSSIDPYSNLFFRIELVDIKNWGGNIDEDSNN